MPKVNISPFKKCQIIANLSSGLPVSSSSWIETSFTIIVALPNQQTQTDRMWYLNGHASIFKYLGGRESISVSVGGVWVVAWPSSIPSCLLIVFHAIRDKNAWGHIEAQFTYDYMGLNRTKRHQSVRCCWPSKILNLLIQIDYWHYWTTYNICWTICDHTGLH